VIKDRTIVVVFLAAAAAILGSGWYLNRASFVDPFANGTKETLASIGMPVIASFDLDYGPPLDGSSRIMMVEVDPVLCPTAEAECVAGILEQQPWVLDLEIDDSRDDHLHLRFGIRDGGKRCEAFGGQIDEERRRNTWPQFRRQLPDDLTGLWDLSINCPTDGEFYRVPGS